jgi:nucleoid-associated protein YgaU
VLAPRAVRLLARAVCGAVVATPLGTAPAGAAELPLPDRPDTATRVVAPALNRPTGPPSVVVRRGDSLWSIAAAQLPPEAPAASVAAAWPRLYAANRARIGDDPHLIRPGTRLRIPAGLLDLSDRPSDDRPTREEHR